MRLTEILKPANIKIPLEAKTKTDAIALNPDLVARLVKLGKLHGSPLLWRFGGRDKAAVEDDEPRQVAVRAPQSVAEPRPHARPAEDAAAGV